MKIIPLLFILAGCGATSAVCKDCNCEEAITALTAEPPREPGIAVSARVEVIACKNGDHCVQVHGEKYCSSHCF